MKGYVLDMFWVPDGSISVGGDVGAYCAIEFRRLIRFCLYSRNACTLKVKIELHAERLCERIFAAESLHGLEEELKGRVHLLIFGAGLEILHEDASGNVDTKRYEGVHLLLLASRPVRLA
jgi:hypothetical protein